MAALNRVLLMGNLTRDPQVRFTPSGLAVADLGLAVNRRWTGTDGQEHEETCFIDIEVWGKQAESCRDNLRKGSPIVVEGRLRMDQWEDRQTGQKRTRHRVRADSVQFLSSVGRRGDADGAGGMNPQYETDADTGEPSGQ